MDPYVAYEDKMSTTSLVADIATAPIKPSTHWWLYTHNPAMWSGTEGLYVPIADRAVRQKAFGAITTAFKDKRYLAGIGETLKAPFRVFKPFGGGSRIGAYTGDATQKAIKNLNNRSINLGRFISKQSSKISSPVYDLSSMGAEHALATTKIDKAQKILSKINKRKYALSSKLVGQKALKWGLRAGKVMAGVGAVMFAWDIAKMVGEPIGRAVVSELDSTLASWNQRFDPELGGRLELSYLSRGAATERQRALQAMSKAQITGRSALGQEAKFSHM